MIRNVGISVLLFLFFTSVAQQPVSKLTFKEAVKIALDNNVNLNQQKNNLFSSEVQRSQSISSYLPAVRIRGNASHQDGLQQTQDGGDLEDLSVDNFSADIFAEFTVFNGLNRLKTLQQTSNQLKSQLSLVERTRQDVIFNVTNQYLQVLLDQELLRIAEENHRTQSATLEQLREQVALGSRAESDLYTQESQTLNAGVIALRAQVTLDNDKATLAQTLQLDPSQAFNVDFPSLTEFPQFENIELDSLYQIAIQNREDLSQLNYQAEANKFQYVGSINGYLPTISLFASYGSYYTSQLEDIPLYGDFSNQFKNVFPSTNYGVNIAIPVFDRLQTRAIRVTNKMRYENSVLERDNLIKTIKIDVQRAFNNYKAAIQTYQAGLAQIKAGDLALKTQQESFLLGASNQVTLAQANQTYVLAAALMAQAEVTLIFQRFLLDYALGTLKFEDIP